MAAGFQEKGSRVYVVKGDVYVRQGNNPANRITDNEVIFSDTLIKTGADSAALLRFEDGQIVTIQANSSFLVREYHYDARNIKKSSIVFSMYEGGMRFVTGEIGQRNSKAFRLLTPNATINIRGTEFMVARVGNSIYSQVLKGNIRITNDAGTSVISAGRSAVVKSPATSVALISDSALPASAFNELLSIPMLASAIPEPVHVQVLASEPVISTAPESRIYAVEGEVFVTQGKNPARRVTGNEVISPDTVVNTGDKGAALMKFEDGQVVSMKSNSSFQVREYHYDSKQAENSNIVFSMFKGGMRFITGAIGKERKQAFRLLTPNATIGIRGTDFMVSIVDDSIYSQVTSGDIVVANTAGTAAVSAGQAAVVASPSSLTSLISAAEIPTGTFGDLPSNPVEPSAIPLPITVPVEVPVPVAAILPDTTETAKEPEQMAMDINSRSGNGLTAKIGTLGYGAEFNVGSSDSFSTRFGINAFNLKKNDTSGSVNYDFKMQLQTASILADWYPFEGRFRTSAGLLYNNNKFSFTGVPTGGKYTINNVNYNVAAVGALNGSMAFNKAAPYLGIGWGNPAAKNKGWGMTSDIGVMFQGSPKTNLTEIGRAHV